MARGGIDDPSRYNPFSQQQNSGPSPLSQVFASQASPQTIAQAPAAPGQPVNLSAQPQQPDPIMQAGQNYSPLRDPEGPLARAGWIGALFATGPSKTEYLASLQERQAQQLGASRAKAFTTLASLVDGGQTPQKAFLQFMNTPAGVDFITKDPNPSEAIQQFMKLAAPNPGQQIMQQLLAGGGTPSLAGNTAAAAAPPQPAGPAALTSGQQAVAPLPQGMQGPVAPAGSVPPGQPVGPQAAAGQPQQHPDEDYIDGGINFGVRPEAAMQASLAAEAAGDHNMAETLKDYAKTVIDYQNNNATPEIKNYLFAKKQAIANGDKNFPAYSDWYLEQKRAGSQKIDLNTTEGKDAAKQKGYIEGTNPLLKDSSEQFDKAQKTIMLLGQVEQNQAAGGYQAAADAQMAKLGDLLGFKVTKGMKDAEALEAMTSALTSNFRPVGTGSTSDYEQRMFRAAVPGMMQSREGRSAILKVSKAMAKQQMQAADIIRQNYDDPKLYSPDGPLAQLGQQSVKDTANLTPAEQAIWDAEDAKFKQSQAGADNKAGGGKYTEGQTATNPKTGKTATFRNGKWEINGQR